MLTSRNFTFEAYPRHDQLDAWRRQFAGTRHAWNLAVRACRDADEHNAARRKEGLDPEYPLSAATFSYAWLKEQAVAAGPLTSREGREYFPLEEMPYQSALLYVAKRASAAYRNVVGKRAAGEPATLRFRSWRDDQSCTWQEQCGKARATAKDDSERYVARLTPGGAPCKRKKDDPAGRWKQGDPVIKDTGAANWKAFPDDLITVTSPLTGRGKAWALLRVPARLGGSLRIRLHRQLPPGSRVDTVTVRYRAADGTWHATLNITFSDEHLEKAAASGAIAADPGVTSSAMFVAGLPAQGHANGAPEARYWEYARRALSGPEQARELRLRQRIAAIRMRYCPCLDEAGKMARGCRTPGHDGWKSDPERQQLKRNLGRLLQRATDRAVNDEREIARRHARQYAELYMGDGGGLSRARRAKAPDNREEGKNYGVAGHTAMNRLNREARWAELARRHADAGMRVIMVDERNTSRTCSACRHMHAEHEYAAARPGRGKRWTCASCGFRADADANAGWNIMRRGRERPGGELTSG
jgi:hypothetical protein